METRKQRAVQTRLKSAMNRPFRLVALALIPALSLAACGKDEPPEKNVIRPVKAMKVGDVALFSGRSFPGRAKAHKEADLSFRVSGPLIVLPNDIVGRQFKKGDLIARIDPRDFEVNLRNAEGRLDRSKATFVRAQADYDRVLRIYKEDPGATSEADVDRRRAQRDQAKAAIKSFDAEVANAKDQLSYTYLKASYDGIVTARYIENFEHVQAQQRIIRLLDTSKVQMIVNIPESLISRVSYVKKIRVRFDAFPDREIPAKIYEVGKEASETTRTYPVNLIMDQPKEIKILPGMAGVARGKALLPDADEYVGIEVPVAATFSPDETGKTYVWVIDEQTKIVHKREVTTGNLTDNGIMVRDGLQPGEWIATAGVNYLREGQQVRILGEESKEAAR
ncbi:MAG: efflux RND transporter periplasmic adaptor subunit [Candidatus Methylomirabilales bacterium]